MPYIYPTFLVHLLIPDFSSLIRYFIQTERVCKPVPTALFTRLEKGKAGKQMTTCRKRPSSAMPLSICLTTADRSPVADDPPMVTEASVFNAPQVQM